MTILVELAVNKNRTMPKWIDTGNAPERVKDLFYCAAQRK